MTIDHPAMRDRAASQRRTREVLIERWLPIAEIGVESQREGSAAIHPPLHRLHVWWARRPLIASRAAVLASLLPAWQADWPPALRARFPTAESYHAWFLRLLGIQGDPVAARKLLDWARDRGIVKQLNAYGYKRAFTYGPTQEDLNVLFGLLESSWGAAIPSVLDPTAGGGSIPFEALRFGLSTYANELNPVASIILAATLDYPARYGLEFAATIRPWGTRLAERVRERLHALFPYPDDGVPDVYLWARTVACPTTGKPVPLSPNWWLQKGADPIAVRVLCQPDWPECRFEILRGQAALEANPDQGTIRRGVAISPWTGDAIDGDYLKREAQAGRMGQQLYAVGVKTARGIEFRPPGEGDLAAAAAAEAELARRLPGWLGAGIVPDEEIPEVSNDPRPRHYGMARWRDLFAPRQLLALGTVVETLRVLAPEIEAALPPDQARAVRTYLALAVDKVINYNSRHAFWDYTRNKIAHTFSRHDLAFRPGHAEMALVVAGKGLDWAIDQIVDAYQEIARLAQPARGSLWPGEVAAPIQRLRVTRGNAAHLATLATGSVHLVCIDPPYYDNVQYSVM